MSNVEAVETIRTPAVVPHQNIKLQSAGSGWKNWRVILPAGSIMADLNEHPAMWRAGQGDRNTAARRDDCLRVFAHDRSWCADVVVKEATPTELHLSKPKVIWSGHDAGTGIVWEDSIYEVEFAANGYAIYRKGSGTKPRTCIRDGYANITTAKAEIIKLYPRSAS